MRKLNFVQSFAIIKSHLWKLKPGLWDLLVHFCVCVHLRYDYMKQIISAYVTNIFRRADFPYRVQSINYVIYFSPVVDVHKSNEAVLKWTLDLNLKRILENIMMEYLK